MRMLAVAVIVGAFAFGHNVSAQDKPTPKPTYMSEAMLKRIRDGSTAIPWEVMNCVRPDKTKHPVNTTVTVDGRTYRCVEILDQDFQRRGVAWTPVSPQP